MKASWKIFFIGVFLCVAGVEYISLEEKIRATHTSVIDEFPCGWNPLLIQAEIDRQRQKGLVVAAVVPTHSRDCLETTSRPALTIIFAPE